MSHAKAAQLRSLAKAHAAQGHAKAARDLRAKAKKMDGGGGGHGGRGGSKSKHRGGAKRNPEGEQLGLAIEEAKEAKVEAKEATTEAKQATAAANKATKAAKKAEKDAKAAKAASSKSTGKAKPKSGGKKAPVAAAKKPAAKKPAASKPAAKAAPKGKGKPKGKAKAKTPSKSAPKMTMRQDKKGAKAKDLRKVSQSKATRWKDMRTGQMYTTREMRSFTKNPSGGWGAVLRVGGGVFIGLVSADVVDRLIATMGPKDSKHAWMGPDGQQRIMQRPGAMRLGAQVGIGALFLGGAIAAGSKFPKVSDGLAGVGIGYVLHAGTQGVTHWIMPKLFKLEKGDELNRMGQLYYFDQDGMQTKLDEALKAADTAAMAHPGMAEKLPPNYLFAPAAPSGTTQGLPGNAVGAAAGQQEQRPQGMSAERQAIVRARVEAEQRNAAAANAYGGNGGAAVAEQPNTTGCNGKAGGCGNKAAGKAPCAGCAGKAGHEHAPANENKPAGVGAMCQCAGCLEDFNAGKVARHSPALRNGAVAQAPKKLEDGFDLPAGGLKDVNQGGRQGRPALPAPSFPALGQGMGGRRMSSAWGNLEGVG